MKKIKVAIVLGSDSDLAVMNDAAKTLEEFDVAHEITISSAHRSPERTLNLVKELYQNETKVIIASAGLAAHLAGVIASHFPFPVIGVPIKSGALSGIDSLYSTVQMPPGIPVATVGIDNAKNAALLAIEILATGDKELEKKIIEYKKNLSENVEKKAVKLKQVGVEEYLKTK